LPAEPARRRGLGQAGETKLNWNARPPLCLSEPVSLCWSGSLAALFQGSHRTSRSLTESVIYAFPRRVCWHPPIQDLDPSRPPPFAHRFRQSSLSTGRLARAHTPESTKHSTPRQLGTSSDSCSEPFFLDPASRPLLPLPWVTLGVKDCQDDDGPLFQQIEDSLRESPNERSRNGSTMSL